MNFNCIEEAIEDIKNGKIVIVIDDENRENEGDFVAAAEKISPEIINFMATHGKGLICTPLLESRCDELELELMIGKNSSLFETPFTISVDLIGNGCTTGISAQDRAKTVKALTEKNTTPDMLARPGHIFPLKARNGGVLRRAGHTEAAVDLARLAGLYPAGVIVEILNNDGTMARTPELFEIAKKFNLKFITIKDLIEYRVKNESLIKEMANVKLPTKFGDFKMKAFKQITTNQVHLAIFKGNINKTDKTLVRVHSSCMTGDIFGSCRCDCGHQLEEALKKIEKEGKGILVYMNQEGRGIGLVNKLKAYELQEKGRDTVEANIELGFKADERDYGIGAQIIRELGARKIRLMSNNPKKRVGLLGYGIEIIETVPIEIDSNNYNKEYLKTKRDKMGHYLHNLENNKIIILAIESSCDDTSVAVLKDNEVLSNIVSNQDVHAFYGGVVPELASREHQKNIVPTVDMAIRKANICKKDINAIAFTKGPGLLGSLIVGSSFAKSLALALNIPLISVDHMKGHILAHFIKNNEYTPPNFPFICLTVSGGHTQLVKVSSPYDMEIIGQTLDDAAGEAFDKSAKNI